MTPPRRPKFVSEEALILATLQSPAFLAGLGFDGWLLRSAREVEGLFGVPDLILAYSGVDRVGRKLVRTCAFEFKLSNWRRALVQAFKYRAFAHYSYVLLDRAHSGPALRSIDQFTTANIGLVTIDGQGHIEWHYRPKYRSPYAPALSRSVALMTASRLLPGYQELIAAA